jgi:hypothetical protein
MMAIPRNPSNSGIREDEVEEVAEVDISNFSLASVTTRVMVASSPTSS